MRTLTKQCAGCVAGVLAMALVSSAADAVVPVTPPVFLPQNTVTNQPVVDPAKAPEINRLKAEEKALVAKQREVELKIFPIFKSVHDLQSGTVKGDEELTALAREIAQKQAELAKRTAEKYPEIGKLSKQRDALTQEHSNLGKQLRDVRKQLDVLEGLLPVEPKK